MNQYENLYTILIQLIAPIFSDLLHKKIHINFHEICLWTETHKQIWNILIVKLEV